MKLLYGDWCKYCGHEIILTYPDNIDWADPNATTGPIPRELDGVTYHHCESKRAAKGGYFVSI
jgi:hypothetical protein